MVLYRRNRVAGGTYFFTVTLRDRSSDILVTMRVADWPYSSFHRYLRLGLLPNDWTNGIAEPDEQYGELP